MSLTNASSAVMVLHRNLTNVWYSTCAVYVPVDSATVEKSWKMLRPVLPLWTMSSIIWAGITICFFIMSAKARVAPLGSLQQKAILREYLPTVGVSSSVHHDGYMHTDTAPLAYNIDFYGCRYIQAKPALQQSISVGQQYINQHQDLQLNLHCYNWFRSGLRCRLRYCCPTDRLACCQHMHQRVVRCNLINLLPEKLIYNPGVCTLVSGLI